MKNEFFLIFVLAKKHLNMSHLTQAQRYEIQAYLQQGIKKSEIARRLNRPKKTINQEINRNSDARNGVYKAELAQRKYEQRLKEKPKKIRFTEAIKKEVIHLLSIGYSPEQIVGFCRKENRKMVSHERIYQFIWEDKRKGGKLHKYLLNKGKRYRKRGALKDNRGVISERKMIDQRPKLVEERCRTGDYEADLVLGKNHKMAILTMNDRATGYTFLELLQGKSAEEVQLKIERIITENQLTIHTLTTDNGKEFAKHKELSERLHFDYYFAHPYHSWERGSNENYNRLLRHYFPKGYDFSLITEERLKEVQEILNTRPRKRFGFLSPKQVYLQTINNNGKVTFIS